MEAASRLRLWEISDELAELAEALVEGGGELTPDLEARLDAMEGAFEEKAERIALYVRELEANAIAAGSEVERLARLAGGFERKARGLKSYLLTAMQRTGRTAVRTHRVKVWEQKNGRPSIRFVGDMSKLPAAYVKTKTETTVDTAFAFVEYSAGAELPAGFVVDHATHLRIG